jgi:hypothetical protein
MVNITYDYSYCAGVDVDVSSSVFAKKETFFGSSS